MHIFLNPPRNWLWLGLLLTLSSCSKQAELTQSIDDLKRQEAELETTYETVRQSASSVKSEADAFEQANPDSFRRLTLASRANDRLEAIAGYLNMSQLEVERQLREIKAEKSAYQSKFAKP